MARSAVWAGALAMLLLSGCATGPGANPRDPLEPLNRGISEFNEVVDEALLKPVATAYIEVTPAPVRTGVSNFFSNLGDVWSFVNNVLQLKPRAAAETWMRLNVNTFFGLGGILDVAGEMNIERHKEDFGQTLGRWGVPSGPYLVLPILGPSTLRDGAALLVDRQGNLITHVDPTSARNGLYVLRTVDGRANLLRTGALIEEAALDKYSFTRDAYLQLRRSEIYDGEPPELENGPGKGPDKDGSR